MRHFARFIDGSELELSDQDYGALMRAVSRSIERGIVMENGDVLKSSAVIYIYNAEQSKLIPTLVDSKVAAKTAKIGTTVI
jgi:hypothetical protein